MEVHEVVTASTSNLGMGLEHNLVCEVENLAPIRHLVDGSMRSLRAEARALRQPEVQQVVTPSTSNHGMELEHHLDRDSAPILLPFARREFDGRLRGLCHFLGPMVVECDKCFALHFHEERASGSSPQSPLFTLCCAQGKVTLPPLAPPMKPLRRLLTSDEADAKDFRQRIRSYNNALAFTSVGAKLDSRVAQPGNYTYRLHGELYHRMGSILPQPEQVPKFAQLYICDPNAQLDGRMCNFGGLNRNTLELLQTMLHTANPYAKIYHNAAEQIQGGAIELSIRLINNPRTDLRRYNAPAVDEIGAIVVGGDIDEANSRDIIVRTRVGSYQRISPLHSAYAPLHYVLLFPDGRNGWHDGIPLNGFQHRDGFGFVQDDENSVGGRGGSQRVSMLQYYAYMLQHRVNKEWILRGGRLLQQYIVDAYACTEQNCLKFIRENQAHLRCELYNGLQDALNAGDVFGSEVGQKIILPSSFQGGERAMIQLYQDAMARVRKFGKPDLFITFTCNPKWKEVTDALLPRQNAKDRPELVSRVFSLKLEALLKDIKDGVFGNVTAKVWVIEFQKRGLPHAHILLILDEVSKLCTAEDYDSMVSAEIPDPIRHPEAFETVTTCMVHGPCGPGFLNAPCMEQGKCKKKYPRGFREETRCDVAGYPEYRRRRTGVYVDPKTKRQVDNQWIVPYNLYLASKYNAHINVEICSSISAVKYLYKYVYKGPDRAIAVIERPTQEGNPHTNGERKNRNEIKEYLEGRYISASEGSWRLFSFKMHDGTPSVTRLAVHEPGLHTVVYNDNAGIFETINSDRNQKTTLTEYFKANGDYSLAREVTYMDFPSKFTWNNGTKKWTVRQRGCSIGRIYFVSPAAGERYFLRTLLTKLKGATSFEALRTINGVVHGTFKLACIALGLYSSDEEWNDCLAEAVGMQTGSQLRSLFVTILTFGVPGEPCVLWNRYKEYICDDCKCALQRRGIIEPSVEQIESWALHLLLNALAKYEKTLEDFGLPPPSVGFDHLETNCLIDAKREYDVVALQDEVASAIESLNDGQRAAYDAAIGAYVANQGKVIFIDGPGGSGKTYTENLILNTVRSRNEIALAVASSGIAALLLGGGRTAHSYLKIPIMLDHTTTCRIRKQDNLAALICQTKLILWDEAPMTHKHAFEAVDRTLRDLTNRDEPFGGIVFVMSGDFRQVLPVIPRGSRADIVAACIKNSYLWSFVEVFCLSQNMRTGDNVALHADLGNRTFGGWLLALGDNKLDTIDEEYIKCPEMMIVPSRNAQAMVSAIYPGLENGHATGKYLSERAILAPRNKEVSLINNIVLSYVPGGQHNFLSADSVEEEGGDTYPSKFLNTLEISGFPPHNLSLKIGAPVMLLRNLDPSAGLCNGTRLIVRRFSMRVVEVEIITGKCIGQVNFIPRIKFISDNSGLPFVFARKQFPLRLAYAMTINKSQGQTLSHVGLHLSDDVFSHGQLYVAFSRAKTPTNVRVHLPDTMHGRNGFMQNVVYNEALL